MKDTENLVIVGIVLALIFWPRQTSVGVGLKQTCIYPDCTTIDVNLGDECPFDSTHGGASELFTDPSQCVVIP